MPIAEDNLLDASGNSTSITLSGFAVGAGTNRLLVVGVWTTFAWDITGVTFAGTAMTLLDSSDDGGNRTSCGIYYLLNPANTTGDIVVSQSGASRTGMCALSLTGVSQSSPFGTVAKAQASASSAPSVTVSGASGDLIVDVLAGRIGTVSVSLTVGAGQTQKANIEQVGTSATNGQHGGFSTEPGAASVAMTWAYGTTVDWAQLGVAIKEHVASAFVPRGSLLGVG